MSFFSFSPRKRVTKESPKKKRSHVSLNAESLENRELLAFNPFQQAFDINPAQSTLSMNVGIFVVVDGQEQLLATLQEQTPGSLSTQLGGRVLAGSTNGTSLDVYEGSYLDPVLQAGPFQPGNAPADLAGVVPNFLGVNIEGAVRNLIAGLGPKSTTVANDGSFTLTDLPLSVTSGVLDYQGGFLLPLSSTGLDGNSAVYTVSGTLTQSGNTVTGVQLPVSGTFVLSTTLAQLNNLTLNIHIGLTGNIAATASAIPGVALFGPDALVRGEPGTFNFRALDDSVPSNASFTYQIDWNNDNVVDETIAGGTTATTSHTFTDIGNYTYKVRVVDNASNVSPWTTDTVSVTRFRTAPNPNNASLTDLFYGGSTGDDFIVAGAGNIYNPNAGPNSIFVVNFNTADPIDLIPSVTGKIAVFMQDGDDIFNTASVTLPTAQYGGNGNDFLFGTIGADTLDGGAGDDWIFGSLDGSTSPDIITGGDGIDIILADGGNDTIDGGNDNDIIVGNDGDDSILAGGGDDFILAGAGADIIFGGAGSDLIIAGGYDPEQDLDGSVLDEWWSGDTYSNRTGHLLGTLGGGLNTQNLIAGDNVLNDSEVDTVYGESDEDFYYLDIQQDVAVGVAVGETVVDL